MSQNHLEHFPQKGVQRLVSANPIPPIPLPCARRSSAPGHVQVHAPPQQGMFQKQFLAVSSPPSAVAATANQHPQPLQSSLLSVTRPAPGWGSRLTPCQSKPPNPETSLGSAQAHYYSRRTRNRSTLCFGWGGARQTDPADKGRTEVDLNFRGYSLTFFW